MEVRVVCPVYPTEDTDAVLQAMASLFEKALPSQDSTSFPTKMVYELKGLESLSLLRNRVHSLRIIDAVRSRLLAKWDGHDSYLLIDKQAALAGKLRFIDDTDELPPLGAIKVTISIDDGPDFERMLQWFVPHTLDGRVTED